jgi:hypothetical protein
VAAAVAVVSGSWCGQSSPVSVASRPPAPQPVPRAHAGGRGLDTGPAGNGSGAARWYQRWEQRGRGDQAAAQRRERGNRSGPESLEKRKKCHQPHPLGVPTARIRRRTPQSAGAVPRPVVASPVTAPCGRLVRTNSSRSALLRAAFPGALADHFVADSLSTGKVTVECGRPISRRVRRPY